MRCESWLKVFVLVFKMLSDNLALENPYLDVEAKIMKVLGENQAELTVVEGLIDSDNLEN